MTAANLGLPLQQRHGRQTVVARLVSVSLVVRLLTLAVGMFGLVG